MELRALAFGAVSVSGQSAGAQQRPFRKAQAIETSLSCECEGAIVAHDLAGHVISRMK